MLRRLRDEAENAIDSQGRVRGLVAGEKAHDEIGDLSRGFSTVLERLDAAGAVELGFLNMAEFAAGPTGHNVHFGHCHNPWDERRVSGGSSSGSGAAVAARLVAGSLGTEAGCCQGRTSHGATSAQGRPDPRQRRGRLGDVLTQNRLARRRGPRTSPQSASRSRSRFRVAPIT